MQNRLLRTTLDFSRRKARRSTAMALVVRDTLSGFLTAARHGLMMTGLLALCAIALLWAKPEMAQRAALLAPFSAEPPGTASVDAPPMASLLPFPAATAQPQLVSANEPDQDLHRQQQRVVNWISRRYRVATDATQMFVSTAYQTAMEMKLDPLLILSVMAIESRFNPFAESPVGAQGLMQVMTRVHQEKFERHGGVEAALNPIANIKVGSRILKEYVARGGSVEAGLKMYVGAAAMPTDFGYGAKVLAEYARMKAVAMGRKVSIHATTAARKPVVVEETAAPHSAEAEVRPDAQPLAQAERLASAL